MEKPYTSKDKWIVAIMAGILFFIFSLPITLNIINSLFGGGTNLTTLTLGNYISTLLFILIARLLMN